MKDRIPKYPGIVQIILVDERTGTYLLKRADEPIQEGTPINKDTLLDDNTASALGLGEDGTPNQAIYLLQTKKASLSSQTVDNGVLIEMFKGRMLANDQAHDTPLLRNSKLVSTDTNPTVSGEICWTYK